MSKINWSVAILDIITIIVDVIGYLNSNNVLPNYAVILGLVSFVLTTIAAVVFGVQVTGLKKTVSQLTDALARATKK